MRRRVGTILFPICAQGRFKRFETEPGPCRLGVDHSLPRVSYREESRSRPNKSEGAGAAVAGQSCARQESRDHALAVIKWLRRGEIRELRSATQNAARTPVKTSIE